MKNILIIIIALAACMLHATLVQSQATHTNNARTGTDFLGFSSGSTGSLDIRNDFNDIIKFSTNTNHHATLDAVGNFSIGLHSTTNYFGIGSTTPARSA